MGFDRAEQDVVFIKHRAFPDVGVLLFYSGESLPIKFLLRLLAILNDYNYEKTSRPYPPGLLFIVLFRRAKSR